MSDIKQIIVMRTDLGLQRGKQIAQGAHASISFITQRLCGVRGSDSSFTHEEKQWMNGEMTKICVRVDSEEALLDIEKQAIEVGLECHLITDAGHTQFHGVPTKTCLAIGPDL
jgi:PTH2 family peptidyl-tRNA hydrolase